MALQTSRLKSPHLLGLAAMHLQALRRLDFVAGKAFIDGRWVAGDKRDIIVVDPATGEGVADVARCTAANMNLAVEAAEESFAQWRALLPSKLGAILKSWTSLMLDHSEELAILVTIEQGKPLAQARDEIAYGAGFLDWFAAEGERTYGETIPSHKLGSLLQVRMQPIGVAAAITPWNFPVAMTTRKAGAALAAGCPIVVKPPPRRHSLLLPWLDWPKRPGSRAGCFKSSSATRSNFRSLCYAIRECVLCRSRARRKLVVCFCVGRLTRSRRSRWSLGVMLRSSSLMTSTLKRPLREQWPQNLRRLVKTIWLLTGSTSKGVPMALSSRHLLRRSLNLKPATVWSLQQISGQRQNYRSQTSAGHKSMMRWQRGRALFLRIRAPI